MSLLRLLSGWLCLSCSLLFCSAAWAAPPSEPGHSVRVAAAGDRETTMALQEHLLTLLAQRGVQLEWVFLDAIRADDVLQADLDDHLLAKIWLDVTEPSRAVLYVKNTRSDRFLVRTVPLENGYDELARESLANIVESAIDVLLSGGEIGVTREEATEALRRETGEHEPRAVQPKPKPATPVPAAPVRPEWAVFLGLRADTLAGSDALRLGPELGAVVSGSERAAWSWFGWAQGGYRAPTSIEHDQGVRLELEGAGLRVVAGPRARAGDWVWRLGMGTGLDLSHARAETADGPFTPRPDLWVCSPLLTAMTATEFFFTPNWFAALQLGVDVDLAVHNYAIGLGSQRETLLAPWRVRPSAQLSVGFSFRE